MNHQSECTNLKNLLFYDWGAYTYPDLLHSFEKNGIKCRTFQYYLKDKNQDDLFAHQFSREIKESAADAVFSVNYFPIVAECCREQNVKYLSWSYDNPLNVYNIEETLGYETNYVFLFDRLQAEKYQKMGYENVFHLPLAADTDRLDSLQLSAQDEKYYTDISFVGNLYSSDINSFLSPMSDYQKGYIEGIMNAQEKIYGYYMIDEMLTDSFMKSIDEQYHKVQPDTTFVLPREALSYAMAAQVTRKDRLTLLALLSKHFQVSYYSREKCDLLKDAAYCGICDYRTEMPKVFKGSKINLNMTLRILQSGIPLRALDIMACGGFLLTSYQPEIAEHFENEKEVVMYDSLEDAYAKAEYYLKHEDARNQIALNGYAKVKEQFNYTHQLEVLFKISRCIF